MITLSVNVGKHKNPRRYGWWLQSGMAIKQRLFVLMVGLSIMAVASILVFGLMVQERRVYLQTYGWSDPVTIYGPEARPTPPLITTTASQGLVLVAWESPLGRQGEIWVARSTGMCTGVEGWAISSLVPSATDVNTQPSIESGKDGCIYLAWRGETSPDLSRLSGVYLSGVFWARSTDLGETWEEPQEVAVFEASYSEGYTEIVYSKPYVHASGDVVRVYYASNQDPGEAWIWYRETRDQGATWSSPLPVQGSVPYDILLHTSQDSLLSLRQRGDGSIVLGQMILDTRTSPVGVLGGGPEADTGSEESGTSSLGGASWVIAESIVGFGWPSDLFEDEDHAVWAVWDREAQQSGTQRYILENGTVREAGFSRNQVWVSSSMDMGETWGQAALLSTTPQSERMGVLVQAQGGGYVVIYASYPSSSTAPWREAWRWSVQAKHTETNTIQTARIIEKTTTTTHSH